jgi:hypothetical protein
MCGGSWLVPVIPALRRMRREDDEFQASLGYIVRPCLKKKKKSPKTLLDSYRNFNIVSGLNN